VLLKNRAFRSASPADITLCRGTLECIFLRSITTPILRIRASSYVVPSLRFSNQLLNDFFFSPYLLLLGLIVVMGICVIPLSEFIPTFFRSQAVITFYFPNSFSFVLSKTPDFRRGYRYRIF